MNYFVKLIPYTKGIKTKQAEKKDVIGASKFWKLSRGEGVIIAVLDTGANLDHELLKPSIIGGRNFTEDYQQDEKNYEDNNGHGTHVAGIIAQTAPEAKLLILKVMSGTGLGSYENLIEGINYALNWRGPNNEMVKVLCMSLGGPHPNERLHSVIKKAVERNISVVVAAGNKGDGQDITTETDYPGSYNEVIQVGAIDSKFQLANFSNRNNEIDLVAPGVDIVSSYLDGSYASLSGTSMAAPYVAGALALLIDWSKKAFSRELSEAEIYAQLIKRTVPLTNNKESEGNGVLYLNLETIIYDFIKMRKSRMSTK